MALDLNLEAAKEVFFTEARQLLSDVETHVLQLEQNPTDKECLNAAFRAAHTIKGSAGIFGFTVVTHFVHDLETVLDRVRNGELMFDEAMSTVVLNCRDHTSNLIDWIESEGPQTPPNADILAVQEDLSKKLRDYLSGGSNGAPVAKADVPATVEKQDKEILIEKPWHISVRLCESTFRDGFDPRSILTYLESFGEIKYMIPVLDHLPSFLLADTETCYMGFEIQFVTDRPEHDIAEAFEFVSNESRIQILSHQCTAEQWDHLVSQLPETVERAHSLLKDAGFERPEPVVAQAAALTPVVVEPVAEQKTEVKKSAAKSQKAGSNTNNAFIRVPADKLDSLINLVGELVIANAGTVEKAKHSNDTNMVEATSAVAQLIEEIRDGALGLRMVQIGETFQRYHRVIRDLSMNLGKQITLDISGEDTELDKSVVERIGDPLMHLVRNAIDHGLEVATEREAAGKSPVGRIGLHAYHDSGHIVIEVSDDGKGLAREKIFRKAVEKGLVSADAILSDAEVGQLIFLPGFSTADQITDISGRGVGMDVV